MDKYDPCLTKAFAMLSNRELEVLYSVTDVSSTADATLKLLSRFTALAAMSYVRTNGGERPTKVEVIDRLRSLTACIEALVRSDAYDEMIDSLVIAYARTNRE